MDIFLGSRILFSTAIFVWKFHLLHKLIYNGDTNAK